MGQDRKLQFKGSKDTLDNVERDEHLANEAFLFWLWIS